MNFQIVKAEVSDAAAIAKVIQSVYESMEEKDWYVADDAEYIEKMLLTGKGNGYMAIAEDTKEIAGIFITAFPGLSADNLGYDLDFSREQLLLTAHMDSAAVLPEYQGNRLQYRLMQEAEHDLRAMGYRYLLCTIHPYNRFSQANAIRQGYKVVKTTEKYGGYLRNILMKTL